MKPGPRLTIKNMTVVSGNVGISAEGASLDVENAHFHDVVLPYDLRDMHDVSIQKTKITQDPKAKNGGRTFSGWQPTRNGPPLPSYCPKCEHVFASRNYDMSGLFFSLWDNDDQCINCGYPKAVLSEGHFKLVQQSVEILRSPDITREMLKRLAELADDVISGKLKPEEAELAAEHLHPSLRQIATKFSRTTILIFASTIGVVSATLDVYERATGADPAVINQKIVEQALQEHDRLWHEKLKKPQGSVVDKQPSRPLSEAATNQKARDKAGHAGSKVQAEKKKQKRKNLKKHRESFGGARSR